MWIMVHQSLQLLIPVLLYCRDTIQPSAWYPAICLPVCWLQTYQFGCYRSTPARHHYNNGAFLCWRSSGLVCGLLPAVKKFVEKLDPSYTLPTRKTISYTHLHHVHTTLQLKMKAALKKANYVCLTIDIWTSGDYLDVEAFELQGREFARITDNAANMICSSWYRHLCQWRRWWCSRPLQWWGCFC